LRIEFLYERIKLIAQRRIDILSRLRSTLGQGRCMLNQTFKTLLQELRMNLRDILPALAIQQLLRRLYGLIKLLLQLGLSKLKNIFAK
jgi:hypothetical protein